MKTQYGDARACVTGNSGAIHNRLQPQPYTEGIYHIRACRNRTRPNDPGLLKAESHVAQDYPY